MMGSQKSLSWRRNFIASSGERAGQAVMPCSTNFLRISGNSVMRLNSALSLVTSGRRQGGRRAEAQPGVDHEVLEARFDHGRQLGKLLGPLLAGHRDAP